MIKRFATTTLVAFVVAGSLTTGVASAQSRDVRDARREVREQRQDLREARQDLRQERREDRRAARWDQSRHNGYYANGRYYRGEPPAWARQRSDYRPAYQSWRRGDRLPSYYRSH